MYCTIIAQTLKKASIIGTFRSLIRSQIGANMVQPFDKILCNVFGGVFSRVIILVRVDQKGTCGVVLVRESGA